MVKFLWVITALACIPSGALLLLALVAQGAPQQAAGAAIAVAVAVIPYVFTRAVEGTMK